MVDDDCWHSKLILQVKILEDRNDILVKQALEYQFQDPLDETIQITEENQFLTLELFKEFQW